VLVYFDGAGAWPLKPPEPLGPDALLLKPLELDALDPLGAPPAPPSPPLPPPPPAPSSLHLQREAVSIVPKQLSASLTHFPPPLPWQRTLQSMSSNSMLGQHCPAGRC